jgi:hypothetical protein
MAQGNRITKDIGLIGEVQTRKIRLDVANNEPISEVGQMAWDETYETVHLYLSNGSNVPVEAHIGQEVYYYVKADTAVTRGQVVYAHGTEGASGHILVRPFTADGTYDSKRILGLAAKDAEVGDFFHVLHFGKLMSIDTTDFTPGDILFASSTTAGALVTEAPVAPNNIVTVALALNSKQNGTLVVRPTWGAKLTEAEDVRIDEYLADGDLLQWHASSGTWRNVISASFGLQGVEQVTYDGSIQ